MQLNETPKILKQNFLKYFAKYAIKNKLPHVKKTKLCKPRIKSLIINALSATIINLVPKRAGS